MDFDSIVLTEYLGIGSSPISATVFMVSADSTTGCDLVSLGSNPNKHTTLLSSTDRTGNYGLSDASSNLVEESYYNISLANTNWYRRGFRNRAFVGSSPT